ncbi:MAG: glycerophosphodiester phosphodiesterase family protein [Frankiaceae bacterium]
MAGVNRPQVVAHRGASELAPEHTLAAYQQAIDDGADALECDVRLTRDGVLVCVHDRRVDRTSNGRGVVSTLELADLAELDFGHWRGTGAPGDRGEEEPDWDRTSVLTLARLLELVTDSPRPVDLAIETKHPTRYAGLVERSLTELLRRFGMLRSGTPTPAVRVMSFSALGLRRVHALAPGLPTVLLLARLAPQYRLGALPPRVDIAGPSISLVRRLPLYVERLHAAGNAVHVWTVNEPEDVDLCVALGVDAIITDRPRHVLAQLDR